MGLLFAAGWTNERFFPGSPAEFAYDIAKAARHGCSLSLMRTSSVVWECRVLTSDAVLRSRSCLLVQRTEPSMGHRSHLGLTWITRATENRAGCCV